MNIPENSTTSGSLRASSVGSPDLADSRSPYTLRISRLTVDKLGVKLYDKVSAVVAELIANSYDADATTVTVELPLATELASKDPATSYPRDKGLEIVVRDDGHGMTPDEAQSYYLQVGRDRREHVEQGAVSRSKRRPVMGRKGIGKLAPFGICRRIEVISSGGERDDEKGFLTCHFFLDYDQIVKDTDEPTVLVVGGDDGTWRPQPGTSVRLTLFAAKRVPDEETFSRQVARRFALAAKDFRITILDTRAQPPNGFQVPKFEVPIREETRVDVAELPVKIGDEVFPVDGWLALARAAYKNEEMTGVRIYARGKLVATTRDFEQPAGFTNEFMMRSYLVGEVHAEWLDEDGGDDLVRTDRQAIIWDSERGEALRSWGASLIRQIGTASRKPHREMKSAMFMRQARIEERANERYADDEVVRAAVDFGRRVGGFAAEDELADEDYVDGLAEIILSVAPHQALVEAFKEIAQQQNSTIESLVKLFGKTRLAELAAYSQIASERVLSIKELQEVINKPGVIESDLQKLIAAAPWLIKPDWSIITDNRSLKVFRDQFVEFWKRKYNEELVIAISYERKRPDFTLVHHGMKLHIVELKAPSHAFDGRDYQRLQNYVIAFNEFFVVHTTMAAAFSEGWQIDLISDSVNLTDVTQRIAYDSFKADGKVVQLTWNDFLHAAVTAHQTFLEAHDRANVAQGD